MIWAKKDITLSDINDLNVDNLGQHLGIHFVEIGPDFLKATMPVDNRTKQPFGLLHGGASVVLAETLGSVASAMAVHSSDKMCVGLEVNANHIRAVKDGFVTGTCSPIHIGGSTHVWDIKIHDQQGHLTCISRLTVAVIKARS